MADGPVAARLDLQRSGLTARERTVARLIVQGRTSKEVARQLGISPLTVRKHRENLLRKLALRDTVALTILLHRERRTTLRTAVS